MASKLKSELVKLQTVFNKNHERFQILKATLDELTCRFVIKDEKICDIQANIHINETIQLLWFVTSEEDAIINAVKTLSKTKHGTKGIIFEVKRLIHVFCGLYDLPLPADLANFDEPSDHQISDAVAQNGEESENDEEPENEEPDNDEEPENVEENDSEEDNFEDGYFDEEMEEIADGHELDDMDVENVAVIKKQIKLQYEKRTNATSTKALLVELEKIYRSDTCKKNIFSVDLVDHSLYHWNVILASVCPDSMLNQDLIRLKKDGDKDGIHMSMTFNENYPIEPPFVQITYPAIKGGYVLPAGALCMEILTKGGWSAAYSIENVIIHISSLLITGNARVDFEKTRVLLTRPHSLAEAKRNFNSIVRFHEKQGWQTLPQQNG